MFLFLWEMRNLFKLFRDSQGTLRKFSKGPVAEIINSLEPIKLAFSS